MPVYILEQGFRVYCINVKVKKIDGSILKTFRIVLASFQIKNKLWRARFFEETFLLADISMEIVLQMPFFILSNVDIKFNKKKLT